MPQAMRIKVFRKGRSQAVRIPAQYHFGSDEVYIERDPVTGVVRLSEKPFQKSAEELFRLFDEHGGQDFEVERDHSLPREIEL